MEKQEILRFVDHTLLKQTATWEEIREICREGLENGTASVCIPPAFVAQASEYLQGRLPVCTVIGFPNGYQTTGTKAFEAAEAVKNGADEIDMVIHVGWAKESRFQDILTEIDCVKEACGGKLLKVIIETCLLTEAEKTQLIEEALSAENMEGSDYAKNTKKCMNILITSLCMKKRKKM